MLWLWGGSAFLAAFLAAGRCSSPPQCLWPSGRVRVRVSIRVSVSVFNFGLVMSLWGFSGCRGCVWRTRRWLVAAGRQLPLRGVDFHRVQLFVWVFICNSVYILMALFASVRLVVAFHALRLPAGAAAICAVFLECCGVLNSKHVLVVFWCGCCCGCGVGRRF